MRFLAFLAGFLLLFPGACLLAVGGMAGSGDGHGYVGGGVLILLVAFGMFYLAFVKR